MLAKQLERVLRLIFKILAAITKKIWKENREMIRLSGILENIVDALKL